MSNSVVVPFIDEDPQDNEQPEDQDSVSRRHYSYVKFAANGRAYGYAELLCDRVDDIEYLPTAKNEIAVGSKCDCLENGKTYILNNAREWVIPNNHSEDDEDPGKEDDEDPGAGVYCE